MDGPRHLHHVARHGPGQPRLLCGRPVARMGSHWHQVPGSAIPSGKHGLGTLRGSLQSLLLIDLIINLQVKLRYLQGLESGVLSLQDLARGVVRETLVSTSESCVRDKEELERKIDTLPLPKPMKNFVKFY